jgi:hypothetical protein
MLVRAMVSRGGTVALIVLLGACGDVPTFTSGAGPGGVTVTSKTSGDPIESDGYTVSLDGGPGRELGANAFILFSEIEAGAHTLALSGINPDCAVNGENPRTVLTVAGRTTQSLFLVNCSVPGTGRILVHTFTDGVGPDHYQIDLNVGRSEQIGANDQVTFYAVPVGPVILTLTGGSEKGCVITGPNPRTRLLSEGLEVSSLFKIRCPG